MKRLLILGFINLLVLSAAGFAQQQVDTTDVVESKFMTLFPLAIPYALDVMGGGARAQGMGKAFLGVSDDISAVSWNPAGLYGHEQPVLGLAYGAFSPEGKYTRTLDYWFLDQAYGRDDAFDGLTLLSFLAPIRIKGHPFVGGFSYTRADDEYLVSRLVFETYVDYNPFDDDFEERLYREEFNSDYHSGLDMINIGFGTRVYGDLSFGAAANIYTRESVSNQRYIVTQDGTYRPETGLQPFLLVTSALATDTSRYSGVNFTIGFKYAAEKLSAGLVVKTPFALEQSTDRSVHIASLINGDTVFAGNVRMHFDDIITKVDIPVQLGVGVGYRPIEDLLLALDFEVRPFSGRKVRVRDSLRIIPGEKDQEYFTEYDPQWRNVFTIRTGGEFLWHTGSGAFPVVPLRVGFGYIPIPAPDSLFDMISSPAAASYSTASARSYSIGTGVRWGQIHLDVAYTRTTLVRQYELLASSLILEEEYDNKNHHFNFGFTGFF